MDERQEAARLGDLPAIETARLVLRKLRLDDADNIFAYAADPAVARYTLWEPHQSIDDSRTFLRAVLANDAASATVTWGIFHRADQRIIGTCGLFALDLANQRAELGYATGSRYWGQGLMTEAVTAVIAFGFTQLPLNRIQAMCEIPNIGSARVLEKAGMTFEGVLREYLFSKGAHRDMKLYAVLRSDWSR